MTPTDLDANASSLAASAVRDQLVERLRDYTRGDTDALMDEAAAELTRLQGRVAALEAENARLANDYNVARDAHDRRAQELAKVRAENSGLVQTVRDAADHLRRAEARVAALEAENARLTELQERNEGRVKEIVSDELLQRAERAEDERDALRADAERWEAMAALWTCYAEVVLTQDENGCWSITCNEGIDVADTWFTAEHPEAVIDAAREKP